MTRTLAVIACLTASLTLAQNVPGSISFNARLTDTGGMPLAGAHALGFGLYDQSSGGAAVWTENVAGASFSTEGLVYVELGAVTPLTTSALDGRKLYLEVSVDGTAMSPRLAIVSVPYAIRASVAATAGSVGTLTESAIQRRVTGTCPAGQAVRSIDVAGAVQCEPVGSGDITSVTTAIGSGLSGGATAGDVPLSLTSCAAGEVLKSGGTSWACAADAVGPTYGVTAPLALTGTTLSLSGCPNNQVLKSNGTTWICADVGTLTGVTTATGSGLAGGGASGSLAVTLAPCASGEVLQSTGTGYACAAMQKRITGTCPSGAITGVNADGSVTCQAIVAAVQSCKALHTADPSKGNGVYLIDPDGAGPKPAVLTYCDMTTDGGGWTLVGHSFTASVSTSDDNKNMPSLRCGGGTWRPSDRVGAGAIDATDLVKLSTEIAFSMTTTGGAVPSGPIGGYAYGYKFTIPNPAKVHFKNHAYLGPNNNVTDLGSGPCVAVTVTGIQGTTFTGTRYTLQNVLGLSWGDTYPTGYGAGSTASCLAFDGGPFFPSIHQGHGSNVKNGVTVSECDVNGSSTYAYRGTYTDSTVNNTGASAIWLR